MYTINILITLGIAVVCISAAALPLASPSTRSASIPASVQDEYLQLLKINQEYLEQKKEDDMAAKLGKRQVEENEGNWDPCIEGVIPMCYRMMDLHFIIPEVCRTCGIIPISFEDSHQRVPPLNEEGIRFPPPLEKREIEMDYDTTDEMNHHPDGHCHVRKELPKCWKMIDIGKLPLPAYCRDCRFLPDGRRLPVACRTDPDNYNKCVDTELPDEDDYDSD